MFSEFCLSNLLICIVIIVILLIEFIDLYNLVIGLQAYNYHFRFALYSGYQCRPSNDVVRLLKRWT